MFVLKIKIFMVLFFAFLKNGTAETLYPRVIHAAVIFKV